MQMKKELRTTVFSLALLGAFCAGAPRAARAELCDFKGTRVDIAYWAGAGTNSAVCVLDFEPGVSYAFGFRWCGAATGFDMLMAIAGAGGLSVEYDTDFGSPYVDRIQYAGYTMGTKWGWPADWLAYWTGRDGKSWTDSWVGAADRPLADGDWDAWSHQATSDWPPSYRPSTPPTRMSTLRGRERERDVRVYGEAGWTRERVGDRNCYAVVYHNATDADRGMRVCGMDVVYYGRDSAGRKYAEVRSLNSGTLAIADGTACGVIEHRPPETQYVPTMFGPPWADCTASVRGRCRTADTLSSLEGPLTVIVRSPRGQPDGFGFFDWCLEAQNPPMTTEQVLQMLAKQGYAVRSTAAR